MPLGQGMLPLDRYVRAIRSARPDAALCLEMITRDPLRVPFRSERYWVAFERRARAPARLQAFEDKFCRMRRPVRCRASPALLQRRRSNSKTSTYAPAWPTRATS